jgi:hypothetical protein
MDVRSMAVEAVAQATGRAHRQDEVLPRSGGPAGNATLTAWTGIVLLVLFAAELVTLLDVRGLISWHLVIGVALIPPALLKTGTTGWRMVGYYRGNRAYRQAGPPVLPLRLLGPLVVAFTLAVLASGLTAALVGPDASRRSLLDLLGQHIDIIMLHKASFLAWAVVTGLHVLFRAIPALRLTLFRGAGSPGIPGRVRRVGTLVLALMVAAVAAVIVLDRSAAWRSQPRHFERPPGTHARPR